MRLGEADPGGPGGSVRGSWDSVKPAAGLLSVSQSGLQYSVISAVNGSTVCLDCSGGGLVGPLVVVPADNWGIEAWVSGDGGTPTGVIAYNGNSGTRGMGLYYHEGLYRGLVGGVAFVGMAPVTSQWTHLAIVMSGGATTFYVNGTPVANGPPPVLPGAAGDELNIGNRRDRAEPLDGRVDEVRIFTFAPGAFSPADLQNNRVRPWPAATSFPSPVVPGDYQGSITVTLEPSGDWRLAGEKEWRPGGTSARGITPVPWTIEYRPIPGFIHPAPETVSVPIGGGPVVLQRIYTPGQSGNSSLTVHLLPDSLSSPGVPLGQRPRWRLAGDAAASWMDSGAALPGMGPGNYLVECSPVPGKATPPVINVRVFDGEPASVSASYSAPVSAVGAAVVPVPFYTVNGSTEHPLGCLGQLRSDTTTGTGFVVRTNVVATAGNVVFDDATLSGVIGLQWLQRRDRGVHEPMPSVPRGFLMLSGYAAQRAAEQTPGVASAASSGLSAAALYFVNLDGPAGFAGELPEVTPADSLLPAAALKFFAGYPGEIPGTTGTTPGRVHAHYALPVTFTRLSGRTYVTDGFAGIPGGAGSPLFVQFQTGTWHPAAILTGGTSITTVCAMDAEVTQLFNRAREEVEVIFNPNGGYTLSNSPLQGTGSATSGLQIVLEPAGLTAGASWMRVQDMIPRRSGTRLLNLAPGNNTIRISVMDGMIAPGTPLPDGSANIDVPLVGGQLATVTATYQGITSQPVSRFVALGAGATFSTGTSGSPQSWQWRFNGVPIPGATSPSWTKNPVSAGDAGIYSVRVGFGEDTNGNERYLDSREAALLVSGTGPIPAWRLAWFGTSTNTGIAADSADPDGDGRTNLSEYAALTDPKNAISFFSVTALLDAAGLHIRFTAKAGRNYRLEASTTLIGQWQTLQTRSSASSDAAVDWIVSPAAQMRRFYRVVAEVP